jgi:hypothetical protein
MHLRDLEDAGIVMALENVPYDVLIYISRQLLLARLGCKYYLRKDRILLETKKSEWSSFSVQNDLVRTLAIYVSGKGAVRSATTKTMVRPYLVHALCLRTLGIGRDRSG